MSKHTKEELHKRIEKLENILNPPPEPPKIYMALRRKLDGSVMEELVSGDELDTVIGRFVFIYSLIGTVKVFKNKVLVIDSYDQFYESIEWRKHRPDEMPF